jgi:GT2 family glycosyltransferase
MPTYNRWDEARISLRCIWQSTYTNFKVLLIEDGCSDGTPEKCRAEFPEVEILNGNGDLWWSGAINKGLEHALRSGADAILWLNDDNRVEPQTLSRLIESFRRVGRHSVICARTKSIGTGEDEWVGEPPRWHPDFDTWTPPDLTAQDVPVAHPPGGRGVLIPAACFREIGFVDTRDFPHYWADHDFHYRAMRAGYKYFIAPEAAVWNVPNQPRPETKPAFSPGWSRWFLFDRRSAMNMPTLRRLLKRHLTPREYRRIFYPILLRHLSWLSYGWLIRKPSLHKPLRALKKGL